MNSMMITASTTAPASTAASASSAPLARANGASGEGGQPASSFAVLLLSMFGNRSAEQEAGMSVGLPVTPASGDVVPNAMDATDENAQLLTEELMQLMQWMGAMPPELQRQFADWATAQEWMNSAKLELAIAFGDADQAGQPSAGPAMPQGTSTNEASAVTQANTTENGAFEAFRKLLSRVVESLQHQPESPQLRQVAVQANQLITAFMSVLAAETEVQSSAAGGTKNAMQMQGASVSNAIAMTQVQAAHQDMDALLKKLDGKMSIDSLQYMESAGTTEAKGIHSKISSHLAAIESKFARISVLTEQSGQSAATATISGDEGTSSSELVNAHLPLTETSKGLSQAAPQRAEASPARMNAFAFAHEMSEWIAKNALGGRNPTVTEAKLMLSPEHLGQLEVKISVHNGQLTAQFTAESAAAKDLLEAGLASLRSNLQGQGVQVERLVVAQQSLGSGMFQDSKQRQQAERESKQNKERGGITADDWAEALGVEDETVEAQRKMTFGGSFHATA
jgi:flagellar hook-length control protein FliK